MTVCRLITAVAVAAVTGAATTSCSHASARTSADSDTLYIAVAATRTSPAYFRGVELALQKLNAERPRAARPFGMRVPLLTQTSQVAIAARFRDDPAVIGVVGHTGSAQTLETAPVYGDVANDGKHAVVAVTPTATNPQVTRVAVDLPHLSNGRRRCPRARTVRRRFAPPRPGRDRLSQRSIRARLYANDRARAGLRPRRSRRA